MADEDEEVKAVPDDLDDEEGEGVPHEGGGKKKLILILLFVTFLLVAMILGGLYLLGVLDPLLGIEEKKETSSVVVKGQYYYKLGDLTVNLVSGGKKSRFFKLSLTVAVTQQADVSVIEALAPRITDNVTQYLRELRPEELEGSGNFHRMHENLLLRVRTAVAPIVVTDVLVTSALVQ